MKYLPSRSSPSAPFTTLKPKSAKETFAQTPPQVESLSAQKARAAERILAAPDKPSDHFAESMRPLMMGIATAAKMPTMKMTIINSMRVKPFRFFISTSTKQSLKLS